MSNKGLELGSEANVFENKILSVGELQDLKLLVFLEARKNFPNSDFPDTYDLQKEDSLLVNRMEPQTREGYLEGVLRLLNNTKEISIAEQDREKIKEFKAAIKSLMQGK